MSIGDFCSFSKEERKEEGAHGVVLRASEQARPAFLRGLLMKCPLPRRYSESKAASLPPFGAFVFRGGKMAVASEIC